MTLWRGSNCVVPSCDRWASLDIRLLPLCYDHGYEISKSYRLRLEHDLRLEAKQRGEETAQRVERFAAKAGNRTGGVVYYAQIGDYIKIGYSTRLRNRMSTLRVDRLLACEPAEPELERQRHQQFSAERIDLRRENFRPSERLHAHIDAVLAGHGLPAWASLPRTSEITTRLQGEPK